MSEEFKLVPVEPTEEMLQVGCDSYFDSESSAWTAMADAYKAMLAAGPQPPALGGEPEVVAWVNFDDGRRGVDFYPGIVAGVNVGTELIDRAHLATLQAENKRLDLMVAQADHNYDADRAEWNRERDQLKARCDELEGLVRKWRKEAGSTFAYMARESDAALSNLAGNNQPS